MCYIYCCYWCCYATLFDHLVYTVLTLAYYIFNSVRLDTSLCGYWKYSIVSVSLQSFSCQVYCFLRKHIKSINYMCYPTQLSETYQMYYNLSLLFICYCCLIIIQRNSRKTLHSTTLPSGLCHCTSWLFYIAAIVCFSSIW
eukprot:412186_1